MDTEQPDTYYISIGSNMPDGRRRVEEAIERLRREVTLLKVSAIYSTPSVSAGDNSIYFNAVALLQSSLSIEKLTEFFKRMEQEAGRTPASQNVMLDIDIVVSGGTTMRPRDFARDYFTIGYNQIRHQ